MNTTLSNKRRLKFSFFFKKKKKNSILKNPKVMLSSTSNSKPTRSTFLLPTEVSYHRNQKKQHNNTFIHTSPRRKNMPHEIRIHPVAPDSPLSIVSNLTGDPALKEHSTAPQSFPLFSGGLPSLASPDDNASSFSMEDLYVSSRQLFQSRDEDSNPFALQLERTKKDKTSFLSTSKYFHKLVDWAFDAVDVDHSGQIDKKELYSGLILIHLKLASYLGPAACRPASRKHVYEIFDRIDFDNSGKLNRAEFRTIMLLFLSQIITRVGLHMLMAIIIIPFLSRYTVGALVYFNTFINQVFSVKEARIAKETICQYVKDIYDFTVPYGIQQLVLKIKTYLEQSLVDKQTDTFTFTMMGILLGMILVPWILSQCDELYDYIASKKRKLQRRK